jgi:hypothetical protein
MLDGLSDKASSASNKDDVGHSMDLKRTSGKISSKEDPQEPLTFIFTSLWNRSEEGKGPQVLTSRQRFEISTLPQVLSDN